MSSGLSGANASNPAVKRLMREYAEFASSGGGEVVAAPLSDNLFEWHFTLRGPPGSVYAGGLYHGRVLLPSNYPFRPPDIVLLTPSGRFETGKKICLSISSYHPNNWQPSWSIRTALTALSAFFTTPAAGAIGSLDYPDREKAQLAARSRDYTCPHCLLSNQTIIDRHNTRAAAAHTDTAHAQHATDTATDAASQPPSSSSSSAPAVGVTPSPPVSTSSAALDAAPSTAAPPPLPDTALHTAAPAAATQPVAANPQPSAVRSSTATSPLPSPSLGSRTLPAPPATDAAAAAPASPSPSAAAPAPPSARRSASRLSVVTVSLAVLVGALLLRKLLHHMLHSHPSHASIALHSR